MATETLLTDLGADIEAAADTGVDSTVDQQQSDGGDGGQRQDAGRQSADGQQQDDRVDGRRGPQNIRNSIKAASEQMPEHAPALKELGNAYFREQAYRQVFPTPAEATSAKNLIESVGGVDGITQLQQRDQMYSVQDEFLRDGNPEVLDDFFEDFPEGAAALAPHYLERLQKANPEAFSNTVVPYAVGMLEQAGLGDYLKAIVGEKDAARKDALAQRLSQWFEQQQRGAADLKMTRTQPQPANDRLSRRETELQQREEQMFKTQTDSHVTSKVTPDLDRVVAQFQKRNKWTPEQAQEFRGRLLSDIASQMDKDEGYKKQAGLRYTNKSRTSASVGDYVANEFIRRMNDKDGALATESRFNKLIGRNPAQRTVQPANGQRTQQAAPGANGFIRIAAKPQDSQIDWNHPDAQVLFLTDRAKLKDGRMVTWRKAPVQ